MSLVTPGKFAPDQKQKTLHFFSLFFCSDVGLDARFMIYAKNRSTRVFGMSLRVENCMFEARSSYSSHHQPLGRPSAPGAVAMWHFPRCWLLVQLFGSKDHQAQSVLGAKWVVDHDSDIHLTTELHHQAENCSCLTPRHMGAMRRRRRSCTWKLMSRESE